MTSRTQGAEPPRPTVPARTGRGYRWATPEARALAAEWCLRQRTAGRRYYDLARDLGVSQSTVHDLVSQALAQRTGLAVDELRAIEVDRLEHLLSVLWPHLERPELTSTGLPVVGEDGQPLTRPNLSVVDRVTRISDQLARLQGLYAPTRVQVTGDEISDRIAVLAARLAARANGEEVPEE